MKKLLLIFAAITAFNFSHAADVFIGPKAGVIFSKSYVKDAATRAVWKADGQKMSVGENVGVNFLIRFNNYVALQPELNFRMIGDKFKADKDNWSDDRYMQLEVPIMVKGGYGTDKYFVYGSFGPYVATTLAGKSVFKVNGTKDHEKINLDDNDIKRIDVGLSAGVGGMYVLNKGAIDVEFRYNIGLLGQVKNVSNKDFNPKWRSFSLNFAYLFQIGDK